MTGLLAYSGAGFLVNAINKFNLTKTAFMSHAMTTKFTTKKVVIEKSFKLIFFPLQKKKKKKKWGFKKFNLA